MTTKEICKDIVKEFVESMEQTRRIIEQQSDEDGEREELIISLEMWANEATCYAENLKAGRPYDEYVDFMA